ncbi:CaiB/BaiF CoA transferase family protein [Chloroflexota bacterium]
MIFGLEGIKVVETAGAIAGPMAGRLLADWGAEIIHIEHPERGDMSRGSMSRRQQVGKYGGRLILSDIDYGSQMLNRNKKSLTLDLSQDTGRQIIYRLSENADVFISNFRPREMKKFKLEYEDLIQINPRIIYANVNAYGRKGPEKDLPSWEHTSYYAKSGVHHVLQMPGSPPVQVPGGSGDNVAALALALGIMTALFSRERSGEGQEVDVSLFQTGIYAIARDVSGALVTNQDRQPIERVDITNPLMNSYQTKDGRWLVVGISLPDTYWSSFCRFIRREDLEHDPRFASFDPRVENHAALFHILEEVFRSSTLDEWRIRLKDTGLPISPVQSLLEVITDPQAKANDFFVPLDHPAHGCMYVVANPIKLSKIPATIRVPAPEFSQHTEDILLEHGYTWDDIVQFKEKAVIA